MQKDGWARYIPNLAFKQCYLTPNFNHLITKNNAQFLTAPTLFFFASGGALNFFPLPKIFANDQVLHCIKYVCTYYQPKMPLPVRNDQLPYIRKQPPQKLFFFEFVQFFLVSALICLLYSENLNSFLTRVRKLFRGGNYSREETIRGNTVINFFCVEI